MSSIFEQQWNNGFLDRLLAHVIYPNSPNHP